MRISDHELRAEEAFNFLSDTDEEHAQLKARMHLNESHRKQVVAAGFAGSKFTAQEAKRQDAHNTPEYRAHILLQEEVEAAFYLLHNRRERANQAIELYRTFSANQRSS